MRFIWDSYYPNLAKPLINLIGLLIHTRLPAASRTVR